MPIYDPEKDRDALLQIQELLERRAWNTATLDAIARVMNSAGFKIRDLGAE